MFKATHRATANALSWGTGRNAGVLRVILITLMLAMAFMVIGATPKAWGQPCAAKVSHITAEIALATGWANDAKAYADQVVAFEIENPVKEALGSLSPTVAPADRDEVIAPAVGPKSGFDNRVVGDFITRVRTRYPSAPGTTADKASLEALANWLQSYADGLRPQLTAPDVAACTGGGGGAGSASMAEAAAKLGMTLVTTCPFGQDPRNMVAFLRRRDGTEFEGVATGQTADSINLNMVPGGSSIDVDGVDMTVTCAEITAGDELWLNIQSRGGGGGGGGDQITARALFVGQFADRGYWLGGMGEVLWCPRWAAGGIWGACFGVHAGGGNANSELPNATHTNSEGGADKRQGMGGGTAELNAAFADFFALSLVLRSGVAANDNFGMMTTLGARFRGGWFVFRVEGGYAYAANGWPGGESWAGHVEPDESRSGFVLMAGGGFQY